MDSTTHTHCHKHGPHCGWEMYSSRKALTSHRVSSNVNVQYCGIMNMHVTSKAERIFNIAEPPWFSGVVVNRYVYVPHSSIAAKKFLQVIPTEET